MKKLKLVVFIMAVGFIFIACGDEDVLEYKTVHECIGGYFTEEDGKVVCKPVPDAGDDDNDAGDDDNDDNDTGDDDDATDDDDDDVCKPEPEICDGVDNDCDGKVDEGDLCPAGEFCQNENGKCKKEDVGNTTDGNSIWALMEIFAPMTIIDVRSDFIDISEGSIGWKEEAAVNATTFEADRIVLTGIHQANCLLSNGEYCCGIRPDGKVGMYPGVTFKVYVESLMEGLAEINAECKQMVYPNVVFDIQPSIED